MSIQKFVICSNLFFSSIFSNYLSLYNTFLALIKFKHIMIEYFFSLIKSWKNPAFFICILIIYFMSGDPAQG